MCSMGKGVSYTLLGRLPFPKTGMCPLCTACGVLHAVRGSHSVCACGAPLPLPLHYYDWDGAGMQSCM